MMLLLIISFFLKNKILMIDINKNNLVNDPSPYLQQHKDNPLTSKFGKKNL